MSQTIVKRGDTLQAIARQVLLYNSPFYCSGSEWQILTSGKDSQVPEPPLYLRRDVTTTAKANGDPVAGVVGLPIYTGASLAGPRTAPVTVGPAEAVGVIFPASADPACLTQRIYATKADDPGGVLYFCVEGPNGFASAGAFPVNNSDAKLIAAAPSVDESATNGTASLGTPGAITSAVPEIAFTTAMTPGDHEFAIINVSSCDSVVVRLILFEIIMRNLDTLQEFTFPQAGFEELNIVPDIE